VSEPVRSTPPPPSTGSASDVAQVQQLASARDEIVARLKQRIIGQDEVIELLLIALFARGHGLFVGVPGLAKTLLITTLADALSLHSNRIQFTPDLMPSDVTGTDVLEEEATTGKRHFRFIPGPVFTNILLADEINRAPPKTQAALLQSMAEGQVTASGKTYALEQPYLVFATQNPIEQEGTYPLPEAQLDRFLFQIQIDVRYPSQHEEVDIVKRTTAPLPTTSTPVLSAQDIVRFQDLVPRVPAADHVVQHAVTLARASRPEDKGASELVRKNVAFGAGPRASQGLVLGAKARAILHGRYAAEIDDVRALVEPILIHRLVMNFRAEAEGVTPVDVIESIKQSIEP